MDFEGAVIRNISILILRICLMASVSSVLTLYRCYIRVRTGTADALTTSSMLAAT